MAQVNSPFVISGTNGKSAQVLVTETIDVAKNQSVISVAVSVAASSGVGYPYFLDGEISVDRSPLVTMSEANGTHFVTPIPKDVYCPIDTNASNQKGSPWTKTIGRDPDGTKTVTVSLDFSGFASATNSRFKIKGSADVTLTTIPRASTIVATDANIGASTMIAVTRKSSGYSHSIQYQFGGVVGYVKPNGGASASEVIFTESSVGFQIPTGFYTVIPNATTGTCTLTCRTYSGSTQIGEPQTCTITVTAAKAACAPQVSGTVKDTNAKTTALTGNSSKMVRYMSNALCTLTATPKNGASIVAKAIQGTAISGSTMTISGISDSRVRFAAKDSRGYITDIPVDFSVVPYVMLTCVATGKRNAPTDGTATLTIRGDFFHGSFGAAGNTLTLRYRQDGGSWVNLTPTVKDHTYTASVPLTGLTYTESFFFTVEAADQLSTVTKTVKIDKGIPVFDWGERDFAFHVPVTFEKGGSGFAPDGFGLGGSGRQLDLSSAEALDEQWQNGWYRLYFPNNVVIAGVTMNYVIMRVSNFDQGNCIQEIMPIGTASLLRRVKFWWEAWGEWEWVNPPLWEGVEFRTTERFAGEPVYTKQIRYGTMPNNNRYAVAHGASVRWMLRCAGLNYSTGAMFPSDTVSVFADYTHITIVTTADHSSQVAYVQIWYTKN